MKYLVPKTEIEGDRGHRMLTIVLHYTKYMHIPKRHTKEKLGITELCMYRDTICYEDIETHLNFLKNSYMLIYKMYIYHTI